MKKSHTTGISLRNILLGLLLGGMVLSSCGKKAPSDDNPLPEAIQKVSNSAKLYTTEIQVHKIVLFDDVTHLKGNMFSNAFDIKLPLGSRKVAIPVDATLKSYIDFSSFSKDNVRTETIDGKEKLVVTLPDPQIELTASKIDHAGTKEYVSFLRSHFSNQDLTKYTKQGIDAIIKNIPKMGVVETCRLQAAQTLMPLFEQIGYNADDIVFEFRKDLNKEDASKLTKIIDN